MPRRPGFFRRIVNRIREVITNIGGPPEPRRRRREPEPEPEPVRRGYDDYDDEPGSAVTDDRGYRTTESDHLCRSGDFEGETATWTIAGWVTTRQDKFNSWIESEDRDSDEPTDSDLEGADYVLVDIRVAGGQNVLPFVGPFPGGRNGTDGLDQSVINWLENGSPPGEWGAG